MRHGNFVGRSFCACARPRRSAPSNPAASFLHPKENTSTPHPAPGPRHLVPTHARSSLRIINTVSFPSPCLPLATAVEYTISFQKSFFFVYFFFFSSRHKIPPPLPVPPIANPYTIGPLFISDTLALLPATTTDDVSLGSSQKMRPFVCAELGRGYG